MVIKEYLMANWASTAYAIEGPIETLKKIEHAVLHHNVLGGSSDSWEGNVLIALGIDCEKEIINSHKPYLRGFIQDEPCWCEEDTVLRLYAEEAWEVTDFYKLLERQFPDIKVYWSTEEIDNNFFATNDVNGKYFSDKYYVDTCIHGNYAFDYFESMESAYRWLDKISEGEVKNEEDIDEFNNKYGNTDDYINVYEYQIIKE